jgi:membrane associated rhomboid family serine protease
MDGEIDFTKYDEAELVAMFGRIDPYSAPINCARLKELLVERGYIVHDGGYGPGSATPSPGKLQALIGSDRPIECNVAFGLSSGLFSWLEPAHNEFGLVGLGKLVADGIHVQLLGRRSGLFGSLFKRKVEFEWKGIFDVESDGNVIYLKYRADLAPKGAITLWFSDQGTAQHLAATLPKERTAEFNPQLQAHVRFERDLIAQSPSTPVTVGLVAINTLVFLATVLAGAEWLVPRGDVQVAWGSNFGPFTTDGEWWRILTSLFIHFGVIHLAFNMWALATFGPLAERLYGSVNYLLIYLFAGVAGSLASISWRPEINSAGASGAIFGILGALLAAHLRTGETFPSSALRPLRNSTLIFASYALLNGLQHTGIDNAAHLGGLTSGFLIGLAAARPITGEGSYKRSDLRRSLQMLPLAAIFVAGGLWYAQRASASMVGEGLYWKTARWLDNGEHATNIKFNSALAIAKADRKQLAFADSIENDVLPFWREASHRLAAIDLKSDSPNYARLKFIQDVVDGRVQGYVHFAEGLRKNDPEETRGALEELKHVEQVAKDRRGVQQ